ncbi:MULTISPECIES: hypothetical protein [Burkholderia cepacia complex]|uniref:hypothetical protein n=1 Tax=Burkholderia cepacia complex TaxID=87882 RepID=UPI0019050BD6|nr:MULTISPECIES: hypothetical protein [Burkholderia cepacia complex]MBK1820344.1 hypothetical protein [Burkholderia orbicola]MCA7966647.1 hypothetical protein [Burkholderia cenocepacia]MDR8058916.1 hypothetical protein [Burkholderia cenocepacia]MDR8060995.1 hypothetical protein [Burkholderia cenocepacia]
MNKLPLSADYCRGATRAQELLIQWAERCRTDLTFAMRFPDEFRAELSRVAGQVRLGLEDGIAVYLRSILEDMPLYLDRWDPVQDLEDPESLYGIKASEGDKEASHG